MVFVVIMDNSIKMVYVLIYQYQIVLNMMDKYVNYVKILINQIMIYVVYMIIRIINVLMKL